MEKEFIFPDLGEGITEGELIKWLVSTGDYVNEDQEIAEIETDKALVSIPSAFSGKIKKLCYEENQTVKVGTALLIYETDETSQTEDTKSDSLKETENTQSNREKDPIINKKKPQTEQSIQNTTHLLPLATPATRKLARELGVDLHSIKGSGKDGRIIDDDIQKAANKTEISSEELTEGLGSKTKPSPSEKASPYEAIPLKGIRRKIAESMQASHQEMVMVTHMDEARVDKLLEIRKEKAELAKSRGIKLTLLPFILKACSIALQDHPYLNASLQEESIFLKKYYHFGFAVDTDAGLMVPVIRDVNKKSIFKLAKELTELSARARERKIDLEELQNHTFSITNIGSLGGIFFTPIIHHPDSAILGIGRTQQKPIVDQNKKIVPAYMLPLALTFDHRIADGATAARFVNQVISYLEDPDLLLLEEGEN